MNNLHRFFFVDIHFKLLYKYYSDKRTQIKNNKPQSLTRTRQQSNNTHKNENQLSEDHAQHTKPKEKTKSTEIEPENY